MKENLNTIVHASDLDIFRQCQTSDNGPPSWVSDNVSSLGLQCPVQTKNCMKEIARIIIWKIGGFRFGHKRTDWDRLKFVYYCCQDADRAYASVTQGKQDTPRMERFKCQSKLTLTPSLEERTYSGHQYVPLSPRPVLQSTAFFRSHPIHPGSGYHEDVGGNLPRIAEFKATRLGTRNPRPSILPVAEFEFEYMATRL